MPFSPAFATFYRGYRAKHLDVRNRALHLLAKLLALAALVGAALTRSLPLLLAAPFLAVVPCWIGHLVFERNRPASWDEPRASLLGSVARVARPGSRAVSGEGRWYYSLLADAVMCSEMVGLRPRATNEPT